jgi:hypothetical protein
MVFWDVIPCILVSGYQHFYLKEWGDIFLQNDGNCLQDYMVSQPRKPQPRIIKSF